MSIEILSQDVQNQIAAGEVVERPAHMIKELIENSFDAGATKIEINYSEGGRKLTLTDNGCGMSAEDLPKSILRYATSKISKTDDLWKLNSYGFRGEALASIAAVSNMRIRSRQKTQDQSFQMKFHFGKALELEPTQSDYGTFLGIENLFENVPARLKFLKSEAAEHAQIKNTLKALALSRPEIEFRVLENKELIFFWPACASRKERVQQVLNLPMVYEGSAEREGVSAFAVMASPEDVQKTSKNIWLFAQNRWIQDRSLQAAVMEAYRNLLMHGEYPQVAVWVETSPEEIDVNIHPTKSQVKFKDSSLAFRAVQASIRGTLEKAPWIKNLQPLQENLSLSADLSADGVEKNDPILPRDQAVESAPIAMEFKFPSVTQYSQKSWIRPVAISDDKHKLVYKEEKVSLGYWSNFQVVGQIHLTYIVAQNSEKMILVDQHAAHERVVFEKLMSSWNNGKIEIQEFLFPLPLNLSNEKAEALMTYEKELQRMGVSLELLGPQTVGLKAAPSLLKDSALSSTLEKLSHEILENGGSYNFEKKINDIFASMACHSVVRAGQAMSLEQMKSLLQSMDEFPLSSYCPHGRPVCLDFNFIQLEKDFGRRG